MTEVIKIITKVQLKSALSIICSAYLSFCALAFPQRTAESVLSSLSLGVKTVVPSVFMFSVALKFLSPSICRAFSKFKLLQKLFCVSPGGLCMIFSGLLSGFPVGAVVFSELYALGQISREEGESLMPFCNNAGAAFLIGGVGAKMANNVTVGVVLLISQSASAFLMLLFTARSRRGKISALSSLSPHKSSPSLISAISHGGHNMVSLLSYMVFFSVLSDALVKDMHLFGYAEAIFRGVMEIGGGLGYVFSSDLPSKAALAGALVGFSGVSVMAQAENAAGESAMGRYLIGKTAMAVLCSLMVFALCRAYAVSAFFEIFGSTAKNAHNTAKFLALAAIFALVFAAFAVLMRRILGKYLK